MMKPEEAIEKFKKIKRGNIFLIHQRIEGKEVIEDYSLCDIAISALSALDQYRSERDIAIQQLNDLGYEFGEKPRKDDQISRQAAIDAEDGK